MSYEQAVAIAMSYEQAVRAAVAMSYEQAAVSYEHVAAAMSYEQAAVLKPVPDEQRVQGRRHGSCCAHGLPLPENARHAR